MELLLSRRRIPLPFNPSDEPVAPFAIEDLTEVDARLASVSAAS
jgi:hypothetical protein